MDNWTCYRQQDRRGEPVRPKNDVELRTEAGEIGKGGAIGCRDGLDEVHDRERLSARSR